MCVELRADVAVMSFISCIATKIISADRKIEEIFNISFKPDDIIEYTYILNRYDDVSRCFTEEMLKDFFENKWADIFRPADEEKMHFYLRRPESITEVFTDNCSNYTQPLVVYLVKKMQPLLNGYPPRFLQVAGIYKKPPTE